MRERRLGLGLVAAILTCASGMACRREPVPPAASAVAVAAPVAPPGPAAVTSRRVMVEVTEAGFVPDTISAEAGKPITLLVTRKTDHTCAREFTIKGQPGKTDLPLNREVEITYRPTAAGKIPFGCAMGMMVSGAFDVK